MWRLLLLTVAVTAAPREQVCGYDKCPRGADGMLNVHLVPHTHDDVGWLKTVDQYFYGAKSEIQRAGVQYILDSVIAELVKDPTKTFIYVETAFFWRWYRQQDAETITIVENLVNEGRLEFIGGGWSMNDEACVHYNAVIDQMSLGMRVLYDHFGKCGIPRVAWQIDPFGHTKEQANLFAQMGFDGYFFGRLDYDDKNKRLNTSEMEMVWKASADLGKAGEIFTGALYNIYAPPPGHCYDVNCNDQPIMDDERLRDYNVNEKVDDFISYAKNQSKSFRTNHIVMTMGEDFHYQDANMWYKNLDKLIKYVNARQSEKVNVFYSTPSCYLKALHDANKVWPTKEDDFMPYASDPWAYWTGYFTSRPAQKGFIRKSNNFLQICKQLTTMFQTERLDSRPNRVDYLRHAMGVNQHHDAVTGTEKQHVADDYVQRLSEATETCQEAVNEALMRGGALEQVFCNSLNTSSCTITENSTSFITYVYNPLARKANPWIRLPVTGRDYDIFGPDGATIEAQLTPIADPVLHLPGRHSAATFDLVFQASDVPPLGFKAYLVQRKKGWNSDKQAKKRSNPSMLSNGRISIDLDPSTGHPKHFEGNGVKIDYDQAFFWYTGYGNVSGGSWERQHRPSGAYIFHPKGEPELILPNTASMLEGPLVQELLQTFGVDWVSQVTRLYKGEPYAEVEWQVGPIPINDGKAKEIISRYRSQNISSGDIFFTDSNGRQMMKRRRNHRDTWTLNVTEPVAGNYYPVNSRIFIADSKAQLTVLTDRSHGGSSLQSGELEIMLHRRTVQDDAFGVGEPLNETEFNEGMVVRGRHWVVLSTPEQAPRIHRDLAEQMFMAPQLSFALVQDPWPTMTSEQWVQHPSLKEFSGMKRALPLNVHLLTLEVYDTDRLLVRLEHQFEGKEDADLSKPVTVSMRDLFTTLNITSVVEYGMSADRPLAEIHRMEFNHAGDNKLPTYKQEIRKTENADPFSVMLTPMQIRTFVVTYDSPYKFSTQQHTEL